MEKIAILGARGMLGYAMREYFGRRGYTVWPITRDEFDVAKDPIDKLGELIGDCDVVINCVGVIKPRIVTTRVEDVLRVNAIFPRNLATLCRRLGQNCFHITTDCVYSGKRGRYTEEDFFDAEDVYGLSKNAGEPSDCMVLRTSIIGEERGQSRSLVEWARSQSGKRVNGFTNHFWNGVTTVHLAEVIETILRKGHYSEGIFHLHSPDRVSKKELLELLNDIYELRLEVVPTDSPHYCDRTLASVKPLSRLCCTKTIRQQVVEMREFFESVRSTVELIAS